MTSKMMLSAASRRSKMYFLFAMMGIFVINIFWRLNGALTCFMSDSSLALTNNVALSSSSSSSSSPCDKNMIYHAPGLRPLKKRTDLGTLLEEKGASFQIGIEVGVQSGLNSREILSRWKSCRSHSLVDLWQKQVNYLDAANNRDHDAIFAQARDVLQPWQDKTRFYRMLSTDAAPYIPDESVDFVYVDARHDYCGVMEDISTYWPKLRPGGIMAGHDFHVNSDRPIQRSRQNWSVCANGTIHQGAVRGAVEDFFVKGQGLTLSVMYDEGAIWPSWMVQKRTRPECVNVLSQAEKDAINDRLLEQMARPERRMHHPTTSTNATTTTTVLDFKPNGDYISIPATSPLQNKNKCVLFSCGSQTLEQSQLQQAAGSGKSQCDRRHYVGTTYRTTISDNKSIVTHLQVAENWCRVALLSDPSTFAGYGTILYSNIDTNNNNNAVINEEKTLQVVNAATPADGTMVIGNKKEGDKSVLQTNWFALPHFSHHTAAIIHEWANKWEDNVAGHDQGVLNKWWSCGVAGIKCVDPII